jgi:DNA primase
MIDKQTIEGIKERLPVYTVASKYLTLTKKGNSYFALCPFHAESSASFCIPTPESDKQVFHCFGCQKSGDVITLYEHFTGSSFNEAVEQLAKETNTSITQSKQYQKPVTPYKTIAKPKETPTASDTLITRLKHWQELLPNSAAADYLQKRKIPLNIAQNCGAGYLPANEKYENLYGERIVFPHTMADGRIISAYGRSLNDDRKHCHLSGAKGLFNAQALNLVGDLWLVEGVFDALALMAYGIEKTVAVFGLDGMDMRWFRGQQKIVVLFDYDEAGNNAYKKFAPEAEYWGIKTHRFNEDIVGGYKDFSEYWQNA